MDYSLSDELLAISSIYGEEVLVYETPQASEHTRNSESCVLHVPHSSGVELRLVFGPGYPASEPPDVAAVVSSGDEHAPLGHGKRVLEIVGCLVEQKYVPEQPVLFELIEALMEMKDELCGDVRPERPEGRETAVGASVGESKGRHGEELEGVSLPQPAVKWVASDVVTEKKSTFVAHACSVSNTAEAKRNVAMLVASDKKFDKATHNISAFKGRFKTDTERELVFQDCDDDGEDAAGGRLLHLLDLTGAENVLVVVSRWYGGIKLGPDRFRIINQVAREALVRGEWVKESGGTTKQNKGGK